MTYASQFRWTCAICSDVGCLRERNEDACLAQPERGVWAVADGMGGHAEGEYASQRVVQALSELAPSGTLDEMLEDARAALGDANRHLVAQAARWQVRCVGSTVVALLACGRHVGCLWAGDSRLYRYRASELTQLTHDHSQVEMLKARGLITAEEALHHPAQHMITRAVGAAATLELDQLVAEVSDGDTFLLCSDGLNHEVSDAAIAGALAGDDCDQVAHSLVQLALDRGGHDNISVVVVRAQTLDGGDKTLLNPVV
ncbi:PP2C-family Ser/Thr phosphatase [Pandoraea terrae]|uniref:PP2C-family Ser/Thr phosphatase n=1 Tax=Pandoraea terrae TaxID=1537710 RepID=A0A5E4YMY1_9BURK|nr:protein phosphatase 2C domain-containing protein [Pandoraea terrae]VVE50149.1 PP2C-family Ser/Thr phosphatase [Pandoraea terrae]